MTISNSFGNQVHRLAQAVAGAKSYAKDLPREAGVAAASLDRMVRAIQDLNTQQEKAKQQLKATTAQLNGALKDALKERGRIVRLAEATFGPRDSRLNEFRPVEGKIRAPRAKRSLASG